MNIYADNEDTIAAISTPSGTGGIAVIRLSGKKSLAILKSIFQRINNKNINDIKTHLMYRGYIKDDKCSRIDDVLAVYMKAPNSYTGENIVEIHSHGGYIVPKLVLEQCIQGGARAANPGEFTLRAFLNGKMDLAQAESVADIIDSQTKKALKQSQLQLEGILSREINTHKETMLELLAEIEANVDFPEEEIDPIVKETMLRKSGNIINKIKNLVSTFSEGQIIKNGISACIIGRPNVGKSSLLNCLLKKDRAIVSALPGTTRDYIEETIDINGLPMRLIDTAGIRITADSIEYSGINITKQKIDQAELIIAVLDSGSELAEDDFEVLSFLDKSSYIIVLNKSDLPTVISKSDLPGHIKENSIINISAKNDTNIDKLKDKIYKTALGNKNHTDTSDIVISELRHKVSLEQALDSMSRFKSALKTNESPEYLSVDLRYALDKMGEITGEITTEDILGRIFSKFCIGK